MVHVIDAERQNLLDWKELWLYKELFYFFAWRDVKIKYKQTVLGFLWVVLQPLFMMIIFTFFFGKALNIPSQDLPYPIFVFSGLLVWNTFSTGLTSSSNSMISNSSIIKKIYFPRLIIPVSSILVAMFDFLIAFSLFIPLLWYYDQSVSLTAFFYWPLSVFMTLVATMGPGSLLAALNVKYRDFRYIIPFLVQILFFLTPVIYPISLLKYPALQYMLALSPMYCVIEIFRYPLTLHDFDMTFLSISFVSSFLLLFVGVLYFKRSEHFFADFA